MLKDLFLNACILIASISIGNQIFNAPKNDSSKNKIIVGLMAGILGAILMLFSVHINKITFIDFRYLAIILSSLYGGIIASMSTGLIIGIFRVAHFGINTSSEIALSNIIVASIGCGLISNLKIIRWKKWTILTLFILTVSSIGLFIALKNRSSLFDVLLLYWVGTSIMSLVMYFYIERLETYNLLFYNFKTDASIDFLTGLNNVRQFDRIINRAMIDAKEKQESLSLLYVDIDFFKKINDTYGHAEGDAVLRHFGQLLKNTCRSFDLIFRKGGDEFSVLLLNCASEKALEVAQRIKTAVEIYPVELTMGLKIKLTVSIGVATFPDNIDEVEMLMEKADVALYNAKRMGRNRIEIK